MPDISKEYPAWKAFLDSQSECSPCSARMEKARQARRKKKTPRIDPGCEGGCCGLECRAKLDQLHQATPPMR